MFDLERDPRSEEAYQHFCGKGHRFIKSGGFTLGKGEMILKSLPVFCAETNTEMVRTAWADLQSFLSESFHLKPDPTAAFRLEVKIKTLKNGNQREHLIRITAGNIEIVGSSEWGIAAGLYHLQRLFRLRAAPILKMGLLSSRPTLDPAVAYLAFKRELTTDFDYPEAYDENYLLRIARAGYTGFHLNLSMSMFSHSTTYPELNHSEAPENFKTLRKIIAIARKCSLEVFISYYTVPVKKEHPLFKRFPAMRGSPIVNTDTLYSLCSSSPDVQKFYRDHFTNLFREAKGLAGVFLIVGCEGFLHCYTAPRLDENQKTSCPVCSRKNPEQTVARLVNMIAGAIKGVCPEALCVIWTYGIHTWTTDQGAKLVSLLSKDCGLMTNFDTGDNYELEGATGNCFDYSLRCIGPGRMFRKHAKTAKTRGIRILSKSESGSPLECYSFPTLPANTRWGKKYANILKSGASGAMFNWKFMGFTEEISQELAGWMSWKGYENYEPLLRRMAERDFGGENTERILAAWRCFDAAMDFHPFSGATAGYFKGPFYIAFTHPLILNPAKVGELSEEFWGPWDAGHLTGKRRLARFVTDLSWVQPFGVESCLKALGKMEELWAQGCALIPQDSRTEKHRALAMGMLCMLRTSINMVNFFVVRDDLFREKHDLKSYRRKLEKLRVIAVNEYQNSLAGLECMNQNPMLGFQYTYRYAFTRKMCESKLEHTKKLIDHNIPYLWYCRRFGLGKKTEWLWGK